MTAPKDPLSDEALRERARSWCGAGMRFHVNLDKRGDYCQSCDSRYRELRALRDQALAEGRRLERERWIAASHDRDYVTESAGASVRRAARLRTASPDAGEQGGEHE